MGLNYCGAAGANSVFTFFQSRSDKSGGDALTHFGLVTESLGTICTHALIGVEPSEGKPER
jgi:hypothetical protein